MKDSPLEPSSAVVDDVSEHVILWSHARQRRRLTEDLAIGAVAFAVVAFGFCLQALHFQHWVIACGLALATGGAAWLFKQLRAQVIEHHEVVTAYQANLGELLWQQVKETDSEQTCHLVKHWVLADLAKARAGLPTDEQVQLLGHTGELATANDVERIQSAVRDLEIIAVHEARTDSRFKTGLLLAGLGLAWGTYGLVLGVSLNALVFTAALAVLAKAVGAKYATPELGTETKEDLLEFLEWFDLRTRHDADRSHLELILKPGKVLDLYALEGTVLEADA